jgi:DNA-binding NarL/FixJ family response regulator
MNQTNLQTYPKYRLPLHNCQVRNPKLLVVDDDNFSRVTLTGALAALEYQICTATTVTEAMAKSGNTDFEVAILDLDLGPGPTGIDLAFALRKRNPNLGIIFLSSYSDPKFIKSTSKDLPAGARYLTKSSLTNLSQLIILINQAFASPLKTNTKYPKSDIRLNPNQLEILKLIAEGKTTNQIADHLNITTKAVEGVISRINLNLGLTVENNNNRRVQLVRAYYKLIGKL